MPPLGVSVKSDPNAEATPATALPPPGDISVGATSNANRIGQTQAMRLAQRFPNEVYKKPALREPLVVAYPEDAARSYTEARIAVLLVIDADGKVLETSLFPDEPQFGPSIQASLRGAHFTPAEADAKPVAHWTILEFVFTMRRPPTPRLR